MNISSTSPGVAMSSATTRSASRLIAAQILKYVTNDLLLKQRKEDNRVGYHSTMYWESWRDRPVAGINPGLNNYLLYMYPTDSFRTSKGEKPCALHNCINNGIMSGRVSAEAMISIAVRKYQHETDK